MSWDAYILEDESVNYCVKAAYATKPIQIREGYDGTTREEKELKWFFWKANPRFIRVWGKARIPKEDRVACLDRYMSHITT